MTAIAVPANGDCPFCAYLSGERPYAVVQKDAQTAIFVTREQRGVPHLLVVPVQHRETILDLTDDECDALLRAVRRAAAAIDATYQRAGIAVWQNNGVPAHQSVSHVHFHVAGTLDEGGTHWGEVERLSLDDAALIAQRIARYLSQERANLPLTITRQP
jgi:histidine triad (HIT) family protein